MKTNYLLIILCCLSITCSFAQNGQPMFRGTLNKNGIYDGSDFNSIIGPRWKFKTSGAVRSTPTYFDGKVYVGSPEGKLYCLDAKTGKEIWAFAAPFAIHSTPCISGGKVLFTDKKNNLYSVQASTGKKLWQTDLKPDLPYAWGFDFYQSSPVVSNGTIFVGSGSGQVYALNESDGKVKWTSKATSLVRSTPTVYKDMVYFGDLDGRVFAVSAQTGEKKWTFITEGDTVDNVANGNDYRAVIASVAVENNVAVIGARDGYLYGLDATTGKRLWHFNYEGSWVLTSVAIKDNVVVTGTSDGRWVQAFDLTTGKEKWKYKTPSSVWGSQIIVGNTVVAPVNDGFIYILDFQTGKEKSRYRFGDRSAFSSPVFYNETLYIGNDDGYVSALATGNKQFSGRPVKKAVFYAADIMGGKYLRAGMNTVVRDYFVSEGYELLNEEKIAKFLTDNSNPNTSSVVVFAAGYFNEEISKGGYHNSILYNYLKNGGKVVVLGLNPAFHDFDFKNSTYKGVNYLKCDTLIGVSYKYNDLRSHYGNYPSLLTDDGKKWGITETIPVAMGPDAAQVTPLAIDENGRASYWVKNYGHRDGTGFVQFWVTPQTLNRLDEVRKVAEYGIN